MILADEAIRERLEEIQFECNHPEYDFDPENQIKQCSIDLRLSEVAWKPRGGRCIDLSDSTPLGPSASSAFKQIKLAEKGGLLLKPGQFLRGRTYEKFSIPPDLAGMLRGRSSFGRLGLSVVCPSSSINPGWTGHMPLMLINHGKVSIRIVPYLSIVQLYLFSLTDKPKTLYGEDAAKSKYQEDDGGPSRYWLDFSVREIQRGRDGVKATPEVESALSDYSKDLDEPTRMRFGRCIEKYGPITEASAVARKFIANERWRFANTLALGTLATVLIGVVLGYGLTFVSWGLLGFVFAAFLLVTTVALIVFIVRRQTETAMNVSELQKLARERGIR